MFFSLNIAYIGYCQSIGQAMRAMIYTLLRGVVIMVPSFFVMSYLFPSWGVWGAIPASELLTLAIIILTFISGLSQ